MSGMETLLIKYNTQITTILNTFVYQGYHTLVSVLKTPFVLSATLCLIILGISMMHGFIRTPWQELVKLCIKISLVMFIFFNWGNFSKYIIGLFLNSADHLGSALENSLGVQLPSVSGAGGTIGALQMVLIEIKKVGLDMVRKASISAWGPFIDGFCIFFSGYLMVVVAYFEIVIAKITLNILFVVAPLFAIFTLFDPTKGFFKKWIGTMAGASFVIIFVSAVVSLNISILQAILVEELAGKLVKTGFAPIFIISMLSVLMCLRIASTAYSLGNAVGNSAGAAAVGGFVGGSLGRLRPVGNLAKSIAIGKAGKSIGKTFKRFK